MAALALTACGSSSSTSPTTSTSSAGASGAITVFAASSLKGTNTEIGKAFEAAVLRLTRV